LRQAHWRATGTDNPGIKRLDHLLQLAPRHYLADRGKKAIAPGQRLLRGGFGFGKILLHDRLLKQGRVVLVSALVAGRNGVEESISVSLERRGRLLILAQLFSSN
jgi:hypothetical protein